MSQCAECAGLGKTCCQRSQVFLTAGDVARVERAAPDGEFWEYAAPGDPAEMPDAALDPLWARTFGPDGRRRVLKHQPNGDCYFLASDGCRLPLAIRPQVCRLYPLDYNHECIKGVHAHLCRGPAAGNPAFLLAALGMNRETAEEWRKELYREIAREFPG